MRDAIYEDRIGSAAVQRALKDKTFEAIDQHTDTGGPGTIHPSSADADPADRAIANELHERVRNARLSPQHRLILQRSVFEQRSHDEIRKHDGITHPYTVLSKARKRLCNVLRWSWSGVEDVLDSPTSKESTARRPGVA